MVMQPDSEHDKPKNCFKIMLFFKKNIFQPKHSFLTVLLNDKGKVLKSLKVPNRKLKGRKAIFNALIDSIYAVKGREKVAGIGIGFPGLLDKNTKVLESPNCKPMIGANLKKELSKITTNKGA